MVNLTTSVASGTLHPPRKSIELEDPGAHYLDTSENEEDVFSDAREGHGSSSGANSPIPITRVEKVDVQKSYGEVPGTAAYDMRAQDAVPDELEIIPDGHQGRSHFSSSDQDRTGVVPVPKTVLQKIEPTSPSYGDVPGTAAYSVRAVPDVIKKLPNPDQQDTLVKENNDVRKEGFVYDVQKSGDVTGLPTVSLNRSTHSLTRKIASPIAADGGFGPMNDGGIEDESEQSNADDDAVNQIEEGLSEDFDDFEACAVDDFGDFGEAFQQQPSPKKLESGQASSESVHVSYISPYPLLDFSTLDSLNDLTTASNPYLDEIFSPIQNPAPPSSSVPQKYSIFLTDRSLSLWSQLVAPPPLQPPNWVRSRIRRLFLVSLGVPVDLDEILPASKQKKLILPSTDTRGDSNSVSEGRWNGSRVRLKQDNASSASIDQQSTHKSNRKRKGTQLPPEIDLGITKMLCMITDAALSTFDEDDLRAHVQKLEESTSRASEVLEYWLTRKDTALGDKEAFEGVIENLVKHARRVRK